MIEAGTRVRGARSVASAGLGVTLLVCVPWLGWLPLAFYVVSMVQVLTLDRRIARSSRPENAIAFSLVFTVGTIAAGVPVTGGPASPLMGWLVLPAALMASRFRRVVVIVGCLWCLLVLAGATVAFDADAFRRDPTMLMVTGALLLGVAACSLALSENEMQFRLESRFDHLTGLLNRSALATRMADLDNTAGRVALVLFDIDLFKRINDVHGHDHGDEVLKQTAQVLMRESRSAADQVYRLGGEEFAVVLPDSSLDEAVRVAQRLREAVARSRPGGLDVTMSAGVCAGTGSEARWEVLYRRADAALLEAKRAGRDQVVTAPDSDPPAAVPPPRGAPLETPRARTR
jgi:diguanylate cyclase (GGDEF)-like protein